MPARPGKVAIMVQEPGRSQRRPRDGFTPSSLLSSRLQKEKRGTCRTMVYLVGSAMREVKRLLLSCQKGGCGQSFVADSSTVRENRVKVAGTAAATASTAISQLREREEERPSNSAT